MSDTSYVPVSERPSNEFSSGLLDSASKMEMGSSSSSPFPSSSSSGFTSNQRSQMSGGLQLPDWLTESLQKPMVKIGIAVSSFVLLIVIIVNASKGGGGGSGSGGYSGPTRAGGAGINCEGMQDMLFGEPVTAHNGHYYQLIGGSFAKITWMDAFHDAVHRCHNGHTGYLASIQSMEENNFVLQLIKESKTYLNGGDNSCWLGAIDMNTEGTFEWVTGNSLTDGVVFWTGGSPINGGVPVNGQFNYFENSKNGFTGATEPNSNGEEDCVAMRGGKHMKTGGTDGTWNDVACYSRINYFVVEFDG